MRERKPHMPMKSEAILGIDKVPGRFASLGRFFLRFGLDKKMRQSISFWG
jgi:hypothetical protein